MTTPCVGVISLELDLHAHAVAQRLREHYNIAAHVFATDDYFEQGRMQYRLGRDSYVSDYNGEKVRVADVSVLWWRRANQPQKQNASLDTETHAFISSEWKFGLSSIWQSEYHGSWVNLPSADQRANAKTAQLNVAQKCGLNVPDTLISNSPGAVRLFLAEHSEGVIIKKIAGVAGQSFATVAITPDLIRDEEVRLCPAVYQQTIEADVHLRVIVLGENVVSIAIRSEILDWRRNLHFKACEHELDGQVRGAILAFMRHFDLRMGVFDLVIDRQGITYFLEINPQGQFLFLEPIARVELIDKCAFFFAEELRR
ncbi:hypothetical protein, partial [Rhizobium leguminosarum]|uniref:hypothetical protein n=1 Tax=Rhizobium leguminosarum TaxID=384 RepID=UPI001C9886DD